MSNQIELIYRTHAGEGPEQKTIGHPFNLKVLPFDGQGEPNEGQVIRTENADFANQLINAVPQIQPRTEADRKRIHAVITGEVERDEKDVDPTLVAATPPPVGTPGNLNAGQVSPDGGATTEAEVPNVKKTAPAPAASKPATAAKKDGE